VGQALFYSMLAGALGLAILGSEVEDEPAEFLLESFLNGLAGPFGMIYRFATGGQGIDKMLFPVSAAGEAMDLINGTGTYRDQDPLERASTFAKKRVGAGRIAWSIVGPWAIGSQAKDIETAEKAFYRWKSEEVGRSFFTKESKDKDEQAENDKFRRAMRRAVDAMEAGKPADEIMEDVSKAIDAKGDPQSAKSSLLARRLLKEFTVNNDDTLEEAEKKDRQMASLRKRIGERAMKVLEQRDAILEEWAHVVKPPKPKKL
jgi:hypothetical protein